jgi:hypothetical protein
MGLFSFFQGGAKYFDKKIDPKCDYCTYGKRTKDGNRVLCEKRGLVEQNYSCKAFIYSPLKRIPVKQLRFVGSIADDDLYIESKGDRTEKEEAEKQANGEKTAKDNKKEAAPAKKTEAPKQQEQPKVDAEVKKEDKPSDNNSQPPKEENAPSDTDKKEAPSQEAPKEK